MEKTTLIAVILGGVLLLLTLSILTQGTENTIWLMVIGGVVLFFLIILGFCLWIIYEVFLKPKPIRLSREVKRHIIRSAHISKPAMLNDLWLRGDLEHPPVKVGKILGLAQKERIVELGKAYAPVNQKLQRGLIKRGIRYLHLYLSFFTFKFYSMPFFWRFGNEEVACAIQKGYAVYNEGDKLNNNIIMNEKVCEEMGGEWKDKTCEVLLPELTQHSPLLGDVEIYAVSLNNVNGIYIPPQFEASSLFDRIIMGDEGRYLAHYVYDENAELVSKAIQSNIPHKIREEEEKIIPITKIESEKI